MQKTELKQKAEAYSSKTLIAERKPITRLKTIKNRKTGEIISQEPVTELKKTGKYISV